MWEMGEGCYNRPAWHVNDECFTHQTTYPDHMLLLHSIVEDAVRVDGDCVAVGSGGNGEELGAGSGCTILLDELELYSGVSDV